jgi:hypothetical protein
MKVKDLPKPIKNFILKFLWFRPAIVYAYSCLDLTRTTDTFIVRDLWAYVGQTRQELSSRHAQHMGNDPRYKGKAQPWSDLYPEVRIIWQGKCPNFILDLIEMYYIKKHRPLYNYIHNTTNTRRITKYDAVAQRRDRDRLARMRRTW